MTTHSEDNLSISSRTLVSGSEKSEEESKRENKTIKGSNKKKTIQYRTKNFLNLMLMSLAWLALFAGMRATQAIFTKLNGDLGFYCLSLLFLAYALAQLFVAPVVKFIGPRVSMLIGALCYSLFVLAQLKLVKWLIYTVSALAGVGGALLWTGQVTYYVKITTPSNRGTFGGIFTMFFLAGALVGNLISSVLFNLTKIKTETLFIILSCVSLLSLVLLSFLSKESKTKDQKKEKIEAKNILNSEKETENEQSTEDQKYETSGKKSNEGKESDTSGINIFGAFKILGTRKGILMIPMMLLLGLAISIVFGLLPPMLPLKVIPLVMLAFGSCNTLGCYITGKLITKFGIFPIGIISFVISLGGTLFAFWADPNRIWIFYASFALLGLGDAGINTMYYPMIPILWKDQIEEGIAITMFLLSLSAAVSFFYMNYLSLFPNMLILAILQFLAILFIIIMHTKVCKLNPTNDTQKGTEEEKEKLIK
ncbi:et translation product-related [Anaeramoeba flamelloides]|uniref:Et translation product-related n=1 Tax=Anaeramoeba flamelloides TaxID=1746091 RepID=A0ABQ8X821_9EUKA|nr:et translation product-related [Anaeramoeba flamelloides]